MTPNYLWGRWVWQFGPYMNMEHLSQIGIFEDNGIIVGLVTYENDIGEAFFCLDKQYRELKAEMIDYAIEHLSNNGKLGVMLADGDLEFQRIARDKGFRATTDKSPVAMLDIQDVSIVLPEGFRCIDFTDATFDVERYYNAIWRGFNNQRQRNEIEIKSMKAREGFDAPHFDKELRVIVVAPNGDYASHCGMWHIPESHYAYVEPVFTLPEFRNMGLGKVAVLEGVRRCGVAGAKRAYVLSGQQFYYSIGFYPVHNETLWSRECLGFS